MTDDKTSRVESGTETRRQESSDLLLFHLKSAPVWPLLSTLASYPHVIVPLPLVRLA